MFYLSRLASGISSQAARGFHSLPDYTLGKQVLRELVKKCTSLKEEGAFSQAVSIGDRTVYVDGERARESSFVATNLLKHEPALPSRSTSSSYLSAALGISSDESIRLIAMTKLQKLCTVEVKDSGEILAHSISHLKGSE